MKTTRKQQLIDSILHMVVNFGEQSNYPARIEAAAKELAEVLGSKKLAIMTIESELALEVINQQEVYSQYFTEGDTLEGLIADFHQTFNLNAKLA